MKSLRILQALPLALALLFVSCETESIPQQPACPAAEGASLQLQDTVVSDGMLALGTAQALRRSDLSTRLMGKVLSVHAEEGALVRAGQVLMRIDGGEMNARRSGVASALEGAEAQVELARAHARRMKALYADSAATKASLEQAETDLLRAEAGLSQVRAQEAEVLSVSGYATLTAPFSGKVTRRLADPGAMASPGMPLLTVEDVSRLRIQVNAAPEAARNLRVGSWLNAEVAGRATRAQVEGIVPSPVGNLLVINALVDNKDQSLPSGVYASLWLPRGERTARLVPASALRHEGDLVGVTVKQGSCQVLRWVRTGSSFGNQVEILSGLSAGESIVVPQSLARR